ncbi:MAG: SUMF1/EgtB/PvdO family nonheme iron enzyme [Arenicellales bacterium]
MTVREDNEVAVHLSALHDRLISQFSSYNEKDLRTQYHPDLSQLGWHLNHISFIEQYWLLEMVLGDDSRTKWFHQDYFPELISKTKRGRLPDIADFEQLQTSFSDAEKIWSELSNGEHDHPLLKNDYLGWFLVQHGEQHLETMQMVLHQRAASTVSEANFIARHFDARDYAQPGLLITDGEYEIGSEDILACDNEQPVHAENLSAFLIADRAVNNAEYLGFMQAGGYGHVEFWSEEGWQWNLDSQHSAPEYWQQNQQGNWFCLSADGSTDLEPEEAVSGLSWYEADAFARYAGCRLPHEFEWQAAVEFDAELLASTGQAWEWCANTFFPYDGYQSFPYERYSTPWFDQSHYTMKGSSPFSGKTVRHPSFRNFYQPDKRHAFAGLRLAKDV